MHEFEAFPKVARLSREVLITEKIDGTNAQIFIPDDLSCIKAGSRTRWITPENDNFGFAKWVVENEAELVKLGPGRHFGEWWGSGIQRSYGMPKGEKVFSLFNAKRWTEETRPICCRSVPILYSGMFDTNAINEVIEDLRVNGSRANPGFMKPEGIMIYHTAAGIGFKKTLDKDESPKTAA